ncbi:hypothetical protein JQT66_16240 [Sulfitobacter mediterraneus]|uniref:hypothetical protein n=1 Tax=Sulfitobacter mediterraneus TaxID=83219 RepID=UPI000AE900AA|nr:hypothetical protein [Sulfitobacter mediterraneus]MBM1315673.1 hypothetical protein [Sulfitobacter mediterraneus]MBM1418728.1 hypothetical protein [Sulfitobacter mediterraneus]MBM1430381.1 hypothetical protein [Sulfitobacter mediterraneus]MBM1449746.1 hypothetical protein [Sulfitobacter mediterraneus]MBM1461357.1 hypothetical protein [Sulfitobacter mediterraneus]
MLALQGSKATAWWHDPELELFGDSPMDLDIFSGPAGLFAAEFGAIFELYIAYFNRAPDALGLLYWGTRYAEGHPLSEMANDFFNQDETKSGRLCAPPATAFGY